MLVLIMIVTLLVQARQVLQLLRDCVQAASELIQAIKGLATSLEELVDTFHKFFRR